jgi:protein gp37
MADKTAIEWADATFNPWVGCTKVSPACDHCYAEAWAKRTGHPELWQGERRQTSAAYWLKPLKWDREAAASGLRRRVFCASLADWLDNQVPYAWRLDLGILIERTPNLDWLLLTKRPQNFDKCSPWAPGDIPSNVWLGTTTENQEEADRRIPALLAVPAAKHFISAEPLLGPIDLRMLHHDGITNIDTLSGRHGIAQPMQGKCARLDWVIVGGESGPGARPMHPDWPRALRDQCQAAGVPFFFKQHGEWLEVDGPRCRSVNQTAANNGCWLDPDGTLIQRDERSNHSRSPYGTSVVAKVGKKAAGRLLDGIEHSEFPA